ncbi:group II truncated hemoglobin [Streptomyces sp. NPDC050485]|uniref:group II truncated hemoglobin n=1 Tax=Streptomyces sp. NPDC050485 TaxID=3365617 RepID=UPI0037B0D852
MTRTPYEWMGGQTALDRLTEVFYRQVHKDPVLAEVFASAGPDHPHHVAIWLAEVFGGPAEYSAHHGGHAHMAAQHLGRGITEEQRRRWISLLMDAADEAKLPGDPEFRAVFAYYIEWGTRMALLYSGPNPPTPSADAPMPKWGWNQTPPWEPG